MTTDPPPTTVPIPAHPGYAVDVTLNFSDGTAATQTYPVLAWLWSGDDWPTGVLILDDYGHPSTLQDHRDALRQEYDGLKTRWQVRAT